MILLYHIINFFKNFMLKKIILFLFVFVFLFSYRFVNASPIINEFMYDLDGADIDWIEIYNTDSEDIDLTTLKLLISNSTSNHGIVYYSGSQILHQGEYGVIVPTSEISAFLDKWGNTVNLFTASFTLPNVADSETAKIEINNGDKESPINSVIYDMSLGAKEDGNSLQLINDLWQNALPTPGSENEIISIPLPPSPPEENTEFTNDFTSNTNESSATTLTSNSEIKTKIIAPTLVFKGNQILFNANTTGKDGDVLSYGKYFWNFGDGDSKEIKANNKEGFTHTFFYEGEYVVALEYYKNSNANISDISDASSKLTIKVILADIIISKIGDEKDFFIEITNNTNYDANISKWIILGNGRSFTLPNNTIIKPKKKMILSPAITGFSILDKNTLKLLNSQGEIIFDYNLPVNTNIVSVPNSITAEKISTSNTNNIIKSEVNVSEDKNLKENNVTVDLPVDNLLAEAITSDIPIESTDINLIYWIGLVVFLGVGTSIAYFIRNHNKKIISQKVGDDFEIIDK